jgi:hypothetical protein
LANSTTATVETLTAEVRVLMVGSRQVTLSVFGQLDEVEFERIEPFGRVRPKGSDDYIWLVGRHKTDGVLVRAKIPVGEAVAREVGFSELKYAGLVRERDAADKKAAHYEAFAETWFATDPGPGNGGKGCDLAIRYKDRAKQLRETMGAMLGDYRRDRIPLWRRAEEAEELPLIVLAGLR